MVDSIHRLYFFYIEVGSNGSQRFHFRVPFPPNRNSMLISLTFPKILYGKSLAPHSRRYPKMIWGLEGCLRGLEGRVGDKNSWRNFSRKMKILRRCCVGLTWKNPKTVNIFLGLRWTYHYPCRIYWDDEEFLATSPQHKVIYTPRMLIILMVVNAGFIHFTLSEKNA